MDAAYLSLVEEKLMPSRVAISTQVSLRRTSLQMDTAVADDAHRPLTIRSAVVTWVAHVTRLRNDRR